MPKVFHLRLMILLTVVTLFGCSKHQEADTKIIKQAVDKWDAKIKDQLKISRKYNDFEIWLSSDAIKGDKINNMVKSLSGTPTTITLEKVVSKTDQNCYTDISLNYEISEDLIVVDYKVGATQVCRHQNGI